MTFTSSLTLFSLMIIFALIPGPGILVVIARSSIAGFRHGVSTSLGIVAGDFVFITLALFGLVALSEIMGNFFFVIKYLCATYLVWLGISIVLSKSNNLAVRPDFSTNHLTSFSAGFITTLGNPKAILFYASILPAFLNLSEVTILEASALYLFAALAVGGVMLGYAYLACKARSLYQSTGKTPYLRYGSGAMLIGGGLYTAVNR